MNGASAKVAWAGACLLLSPGLTLQLPCPQGSPDCRKQCEPDYYLDKDGRCTACVSCARGKGCVLPSRGYFSGWGLWRAGGSREGREHQDLLPGSRLAPWCLSFPLWICGLLSDMMFCIRFQRDLVNPFPQGRDSHSLNSIFTRLLGEECMFLFLSNLCPMWVSNS